MKQIECDESPLLTYLRDSLREIADEYAADPDPDQQPPGEAAEQACLTLFDALASRWPHPSRFPWPALTTAGDGALFANWRNDAREVILSFQQNGDTRLLVLDKDAGRVRSRASTSAPGIDALSAAHPCPVRSPEVARKVKNRFERRQQG